MTDKKLKVSNAAYTELAIQIATLDMKLNKVLELLNKPEITIRPLSIMTLEDVLKHNENAAGLFSDIVKSDNKNFEENFK